MGAIEDYVFEMKHKNEENEKSRRAYMNKNRGNKLPAGGIANAPQQSFQKMGRSARIMAEKEAASAGDGKGGLSSSNGDIKLQRGHAAKEELRKKLKSVKSKPTSAEDNAKAADALKQQLLSNGPATGKDADDEKMEEDVTSTKRKASEISAETEGKSKQDEDEDEEMFGAEESSDDKDDDADEDDDVDETNEEESEEDEAAMDEAKKKLKEKMNAIERSKLDDYSKNVKDNVRLHEPGWKVCNFCIFFMYLVLWMLLINSFFSFSLGSVLY